jgi:hypothetical protein
MTKVLVRISKSSQGVSDGEEIFKFTNGGDCLIGRDEENDWVQDAQEYSGFSGAHARLRIGNDGQLSILDPAWPGERARPSRFGTFVNGERVSGEKPFTVKDDVRFVAIEDAERPEAARGLYRLILSPRLLTEEDIAAGLELRFEALMLGPAYCNNDGLIAILTRDPNQPPPLTESLPLPRFDDEALKRLFEEEDEEGKDNGDDDSSCTPCTLPATFDQLCIISPAKAIFEALNTIYNRKTFKRDCGERPQNYRLLQPLIQSFRFISTAFFQSEVFQGRLRVERDSPRSEVREVFRQGRADFIGA